MQVEVRLEGMKQLEARFSELEVLAQERLLKRILKNIAKPVVDQARVNASIIARSGALAASIKGVAIRARGNVAAQITVGPIFKNRPATYAYNSFYGRKVKGVFHGHFVEFGHRIGTRQTGVLIRGSRAQTQKGQNRYATRLAGGRIKGGQSQGSVPKREWFGPAVRAHKDKLPPAFMRQLTRAVTRMEKRRQATQINADVLVDRE